MFSFLFGALLVIFILLVWSFRILREYERGVVFNLGRYWAVKGPGWFILIPVIQQMVKMDLRTVVLDVPPQDVITRDNVSVKVNAVVYFRVIDPQKAVIQVADFLTATNLLAQTTLRAVLGKHELDALLAEREQLNLDIQKTLDAQTETWGIKVSVCASSVFWMSRLSCSRSASSASSSCLPSTARSVVCASRFVAVRKSATWITAFCGSMTRKYTTAFTFTETLSRVITSCGGTSSTTVRRSIFTICWIT